MYSAHPFFKNSRIVSYTQLIKMVKAIWNKRNILKTGIISNKCPGYAQEEIWGIMPVWNTSEKFHRSQQQWNNARFRDMRGLRLHVWKFIRHSENAMQRRTPDSRLIILTWLNRANRNVHEVDETGMRVEPMEALNKTPMIDIKLSMPRVENNNI